jgi:hypothetical protein
VVEFPELEVTLPSLKVEDRLFCLHFNWGTQVSTGILL